MRRQTIIVLGVALLLFVAVGASAQLVNPSSEGMLDDHEQRIAALEEQVFGNEKTDPTTETETTPTTQPKTGTPPTTQTQTGTPPTTQTETGTPPTTQAQTGTPPTTQADAGATGGSPSTTVPGGAKHLVIAEDTLIENQTMVLRPGDTVEFRNGARLSFGKGASADWQGTPTSTWSDDGRVQNLDRDIDIFGEGDIRFEHGSLKSVIRFVEVDLQPLQELSHYPLHWHHAMDGSRGTLVEGVVIKNSTNRAFVPHASHGITIRDSIAKNTVGDAFWWDRPEGTDTSNNTNDTVWERNLADGVRNHFGDNRGYRLSAFRIGAGAGNVAIGNVAMNVKPSHVKDCSGFHWPEMHIAQMRDAWVFKDNVAHSNTCHGIFVWQNSGSTVVENFRAYDNGKWDISHGAYNNNYTYRNFDVETIRLQAVGVSFEGGEVDVVVAHEHRFSKEIQFTGTDIGAFIINSDKSGSGNKHPAHYIFTDTTLTFDDVSEGSGGAFPGTLVTINGVTRSYG